MTATTSSIAARLESLIGAPHNFPDSFDPESYAIDGAVPSAVAKPTSAAEAAEIIRFAAKEKLTVIPTGAHTKLSIGARPSRYDIALDMCALHQIAHYDPADLTVSVDAGMTIPALNATLLEHGQFLPLLVPYYSQSTVGGTVASGIDSPLRNAYGTARDFLLGSEFIDGTGALVKSGGRVVKNVSGYDLHKLLIGSLGTLAIITRLNFRTFPSVIAGSRGFVASFSNPQGALALLRAILQSPLTPLTLDILSPGLAQIFSEWAPTTPEAPSFSGQEPHTNHAPLPPIGDWFRPGEWQLCTAFAGAPEVLDRYTRDLTHFAEDSRATATALLDDATRPAVWGRLREALSMLLVSSPATVVFKISILPSHHAALLAHLQQIADHNALPHALIARAGGTLYFALLPASANDATATHLAQVATQILQSVSAAGGETNLLFAPPTLKTRDNIWSSSRSDLPLMRCLKSAFDPQNIFAPGRF